MDWVDRGEIYAGDWKEDLPHGEGEYIWDNSKVNIHRGGGEIICKA